MLDFDGCQVAPGTSCAFEIHLKNSYAGAMRSVNFTAEVFEYATIEERRTVDAPRAKNVSAMTAAFIAL